MKQYFLKTRPLEEIDLAAYDPTKGDNPKWWAFGRHLLEVSSRSWEVRVKHTGTSHYLYVTLEGITIKLRFSDHRQRFNPRRKALDRSECHVFADFSKEPLKRCPMLLKALFKQTRRDRLGIVWKDAQGIYNVRRYGYRYSVGLQLGPLLTDSKGKPLEFESLPKAQRWIKRRLREEQAAKQVNQA